MISPAFFCIFRQKYPCKKDNAPYGCMVRCPVCQNALRSKVFPPLSLLTQPAPRKGSLAQCSFYSKVAF